MSRKLTAEHFLTDIASNGLLIERESGLYSFAHQTFQEYLAATHIRDKGLVNVLVENIDDVWWRETTLLYTARSDADPIVRACLASTGVTALSLAFDCTDQGSELAPELRDRLDDLLASAFASSTDPERRRLMAGVLLTRHLRYLIRVGNGGHICARPITIDLYQLYQQDTHGPVPQHFRHMESGTQEPITGVNRSDAVTFVRWVNNITDSDTVYRLPTLTEINDPAFHRALTPPKLGIPPHSVWLEPDNEHYEPALWAPAGSRHPHLIDAAMLASHIKDDIKRSTPTLIRLLLLRSIITIRVFALSLERDLNRDIALDRDRDRNLARDLYLDIDRALELSRARALNLDLDVPRDLLRARARALDLASARDRDHAGIVAHARARDFAHAVAHARALDLDLARDLYLDIDCALDCDRAPYLEDFRTRVMGSALTHAFTHVLRRDTPTAIWTAEFAQEFVDEMGFANSHYIVPPDTLADKVYSGQQAMVNLLGSSNKTDLPLWAHQVAINLQEIALPVFTKKRSLTTETATVIRLAALCLAAEADTHDTNQLGDTFREIAAGVTLLERRATGQAVPTETIMLAVT